VTIDYDVDEHLEAVLAGVGAHLEVPEAPEWRPAGARPPARSRRRVLALAAGVAAVAGASGVVGGPVRDAAAEVGDWLGLGGTRVEEGAADPTGLPPLSDDLPPVPVARAEAALGRPLPVVGHPDLGRPDLVVVPPEGGVVLGWDRGATTLWVQRATDPPGGRTVKVLGELDSAEAVDDLGEAAVLIEDDHVLVTPHRRLAAGAVLLWMADGWEYRLESDLPTARMLAAARSVH
jgi:hypothetical protein